jgi:hypothetical protein
VDLTGWPEANALREPSAVSWRQFRELVDRLRPVVGDVTLAPGTELGPFAGVVSGGPADFVLGPIHLLFVTPGAHARLADAGLALPPVVPAQVRARGRAPMELWEFDVPCGGRLADASYDPRSAAACPTCGRRQRALRGVVIEAGSMLPGAPLLRPWNHPTVRLATESFAAAVRAAGLTGLAFTPADITEADA